MSALHISRDLPFYEFPNFSDKQERLPVALQGKAYRVKMEWEIKHVWFHYKSIKDLSFSLLDPTALPAVKLGRGLNLIHNSFRVCSTNSMEVRVIDFIIGNTKFPASFLFILQCLKHIYRRGDTRFLNRLIPKTINYTGALILVSEQLTYWPSIYLSQCKYFSNTTVRYDHTVVTEWGIIKTKCSCGIVSHTIPNIILLDIIIYLVVIEN